MNVADIREFIDYNYWRRDLILAQASKLTPAQLDAPNTYPDKSLRATLVHMLGAEIIWRSRLQLGISPTTFLAPSDVPTLADIQQKWRAEETTMREFVSQLDDTTTNRVVEYKATNGSIGNGVTWRLLMQVVFHGMQHCADCAQMLTDFGHSPGNIDYLMYQRAKLK
jgi:uncharacterized damage-inducible protein DinB